MTESVYPSERTSARFVVWGAWALGTAGLIAILWPGLSRGNFDGRETAVSASGLWSTRLLLLALLMSQLSRVVQREWLRRCPKIFGVLAFVYCTAHGLFYIWSAELWPHDLRWLIRQPYLLAGLIAFLLLTPLALTSSRAAVRRLGPSTWHRIHLGIYPATALVLAHECLYPHDNSAEMVLHALTVGALFALRFQIFIRGRAAGGKQAARSPGAVPGDPIMPLLPRGEDP